MTRLFDRSTSRPASLRVLGPVVLAAAVAAAGCGTGSAAPAPSTSASGGSSAFRQCLDHHGIKPPAGRPAGGAPHTAHTPPAGAASGAFRKALQACGGSFPGHGG